MGADSNQLHVEPGAVTALREAFAAALAKVDRQIALAGNDLRVSGWANDPVSAQATTEYNHHSVDAGSALEALRAYRHQLDTAVQTLDMTAYQYQVSEQDNSMTVGKEETGSG